MNVALYARVSTEEQAVKGYSIDAQLDDLRRYCKDKDLEIFGEYVDEGISARKKWQKRDEFVRMINDVKADKVDLILLVKLDRWFRSVADYYEVQSILDEHDVVWKCTQEDYDTTTANGKLMLNLKLAIAQDEADRTSERIKFVQANKVRNGEVISGSAPFGFYIDRSNGKKVLKVDDEKIEIVKDAFSFYRKCQSNRKTRFYVGNKYGIHWTTQTFKKMIENPIYYGEYRGNEDYCPAPFTKDYMESLQDIGTKYGQWTRQRKHTYIFGGLIRCPVCGNLMGGFVDGRRGGLVMRYRCSTHANRNACPFNRSVLEKNVEEALLKNIEQELGDHILRMEYTRKESKDVDLKDIRKKMDRLEQLFIDGLISRAKFNEQYMPLLELTKAKKERGYSKTKKLIETDFRSMYEKLSQEQKRTLWRGILESVAISEDFSEIRPNFL